MRTEFRTEERDVTFSRGARSSAASPPRASKQIDYKDLATSRDTSPRPARSSRAASPARSRSTSASSRSRSSARASSRCCRTPISTEARTHGNHSAAEGREPRQHRRSRQGEVRLRPQLPAAAGKATLATPANVAKFEERRAELERVAREQATSASERAEAMKDFKLTIVAKAGTEGKLFGSIGTADIAEACARKASRCRAAKCACRVARCGWSAITSSICTCMPTSTCR